MKVLSATACILATLLAASTSQSFAKSGGLARSAPAAVKQTTGYPTVVTRDHRGRFGDKGGGIRVCPRGAAYCIIRHQ